MDDWDGYYASVGDKPNPIVVSVVKDWVRGRGAALDLGAGNLRDSKYLLKQGFSRVVAVDRAESTAKFLVPDIEFVKSEVENYVPELGTYDLIVSSGVLFWIPIKGDVWRVLRRAHAALCPGGIFVFNLLGPRDEWVATKSNEVSWFACEEAFSIMRIGFEPLLFNYQYEPEGKVANGKPKAWDMFTCILRK